MLRERIKWLFDEGDPVGGGNQDPPANQDPPKNDPPADDKKFTQADVDKIIGDRLKRERDGWKKELEEEKRKADMTANEKLADELKQANEKISATETKANARAITAEAKIAAQAAGIKPERITAALKLADFSDVAVGEDGEPDAKAVKSKIEALLKEYPEFKGESGSSGGSDFGGGAGGSKLDVKNMSKKDFDALQARVMRGEKITL